MVFDILGGVDGLFIDLLDEEAEETPELVRSIIVSALDNRSWSPLEFERSPEDAVRDSMRFANPLFREGDGTVCFKVDSEDESNIPKVSLSGSSRRMRETSRGGVLCLADIFDVSTRPSRIPLGLTVDFPLES